MRMAKVTDEAEIGVEKIFEGMPNLDEMDEIIEKGDTLMISKTIQKVIVSDLMCE